jgi:hypothetical protein
MSKDYERVCATGEAFIYAAMSGLMVPCKRTDVTDHREKSGTNLLRLHRSWITATASSSDPRA